MGVQVIVQKHTTHSIISIINLPTYVSVDKDRSNLYRILEKRLKGIIVYRDGLRISMLVTSEKEQENIKKTQSTY
ncbi:MAG: hypothetical protein ABI045_03265 [Flavobacteriales bacterium]